MVNRVQNVAKISPNLTVIIKKKKVSSLNSHLKKDRNSQI